MHIGILGASSFLAERVLPALTQGGHQVSAFTRRPAKASCTLVNWRSTDDWNELVLDVLLSFAPIWVLPDYFDQLARTNVRRIVALSSTSRFTKAASPDTRERDIAVRLAHTEEHIERWAMANQIECVILRPTMIYGFARDKNITEVARFINRFSFFPLIGGGTGLRQPVHADDVIQACMAAVQTPGLISGAFNLSGGEVLPYHEMVNRIFQALGRRKRIVPLPPRILSTLVAIMRCLPAYRHLSSALVGRMNQHLVFEHSEARHQLNYSPRSFQLTPEDLPRGL